MSPWNPDLAESRCLVGGESLDLVGQLTFERHPSAIDQNGYNGDLSPEGGRNFNADEITRVVQQWRAARPALEPRWPMTANRTSHFSTSLIESLDKIYAERNIVDVFENFFLPKSRSRRS